MKATSVRLDDETLDRLGRMAEAMDRPRAWLMAHAIKKFVEQEDWFIREVELGLADADDGQLIEHSDVKAKWEAKRAAAFPGGHPKSPTDGHLKIPHLRT